jgi:hypothetical protein
LKLFTVAVVRNNVLVGRVLDATVNVSSLHIVFREFRIHCSINVSLFKALFMYKSSVWKSRYCNNVMNYQVGALLSS